MISAADRIIGRGKMPPKVVIISTEGIRCLKKDTPSAGPDNPQIVAMFRHTYVNSRSKKTGRTTQWRNLTVSVHWQNVIQTTLL